MTRTQTATRNVYVAIYLTGLHNATIRKMIKIGKLKALSQHKKYFIPKQYLLDFVVTQDFIRCKSKSKTFLDLIHSYKTRAVHHNS